MKKLACWAVLCYCSAWVVSGQSTFEKMRGSFTAIFFILVSVGLVLPSLSQVHVVDYSPAGCEEGTDIVHHSHHSHHSHDSEPHSGEDNTHNEGDMPDCPEHHHHHCIHFSLSFALLDQGGSSCCSVNSVFSALPIGEVTFIPSELVARIDRPPQA